MLLAKLETILNFTSFLSAVLFMFRGSFQDPTAHLTIFLLSLLQSLMVPQPFFVFHDLKILEYQKLFRRLSLKLHLSAVLSLLG